MELTVLTNRINVLVKEKETQKTELDLLKKLKQHQEAQIAGLVEQIIELNKRANNEDELRWHARRDCAR